MGIDIHKVWPVILECGMSDLSVDESMQKVIEACSDSFPHKDWTEFAKINFEDLKGLKNWIPDLLSNEPPEEPIKGAWIGIVNLLDGQQEYSDMYFSGTSEYDPDDEEFGWHFTGVYYPEGRFADSSSLRQIYEIAYRKSGLGNDAEYPLCLAFAGFSIKTLLRDQTTSLVSEKLHRFGITVGYDEGDFIHVGELTPHGLRIEFREA